MKPAQYSKKAGLSEATQYLALAMACAARGRPGTQVAYAGDVEELLTEAQRHRVAAPVLETLAAMVGDRDASATDRLRTQARTKRFKAMRLSAEAGRLSRALSDAGIRHLSIKGPVLAQELFGDPAARDSKDLDFLIDPAQAFETHQVLSRMGMHCEEPLFIPASAGDAVLWGKHRIYFGNQTHVEIHRRLMDVPEILPLSFETLWELRGTVRVGGVAVPVLHAAHNLLYLCAHGIEHSWFRLKWLHDIARIATCGDRQTLEMAQELARSWRSEELLVAPFDLAEQVFGVSNPFGRASTPLAIKLASLAKSAIAAPAEMTSAPPIAWLVRKLPVHFQLRRDWRYRAQFLRHLFLAPRSFETGARASWLRLPLRPLLFARHRLASRSPRHDG